MRRVGFLAVVFVAGCSPEIPGGVYVCANDEDCPPDFACMDDRCWPSSGCMPQDCQQLRANCGFIDDGCGTEIDCGQECPSGQACGGGGIPNICACQPTECFPGYSCGVIPDNCGGFLDCGECFGGFACGVDGVCACDGAIDCAAMGLCGIVADACGGLIDCGECPVGTPNCGGDGVPNQCGTGTCVPTTCSATSCGTIPDGCGGVAECGDCTDPSQFCGAVAPNECGCIELTCEQMGFDCGSFTDPCSGVEMTCGDGSCPFGTTCGGGGIENVCGCPTRSCDGRCGSLTDPCSMTDVDCGACPGGQDCGTDHVCRCAADAGEENDDLTNNHNLGKLTSGDVGQYSQFGIDAPRDADWFGWQLDPTSFGATYSFRLTVQNIPSDADYDIELRPLCLSLAQVVTCTPPAVPIERNLGCRSSTAGNSNETIDMEVTGCSLGAVAAGVVPVVFGETCSNYEMEIRLTTTPAPL